jgi:hypothetical protein
MTTQSGTEALEARANFLRSRLANTIDSIATRARDFASPRVQLARNVKKIAVAGAVMGAVLIGSVVLAIVRARGRRHRMPQERVQALARWWKHPERVASTRKQPIMFEIARNVIVGAISFLSIQYLKRAGSRALPASTT